MAIEIKPVVLPNGKSAFLAVCDDRPHEYIALTRPTAPEALVAVIKEMHRPVEINNHSRISL